MCWPAIESAHIPPTLKGVRSRMADGRVPVTADALLSKATSVAHVAVLVSYDPQEVEAERKQGGAQQVTQSCQVRDGETVRIFAAPPHGVHHPVCYGQQQQHLEQEEGRITLRLPNVKILQVPTW